MELVDPMHTPPAYLCCCHLGQPARASKLAALHPSVTPNLCQPMHACAPVLYCCRPLTSQDMLTVVSMRIVPVDALMHCCPNAHFAS
eukprot:422779-Pelagomonas_calceolata.AAC.4